MMYRRESVERGQKIADNIRKILLNCDLRIVYATSEVKLASEDFKLHSKLGGTSHQRKALRAKARCETYKIYIKNVEKIKGEISVALDAVLSRYTPKYKKIWIMYFIEQASIDDICNTVNYSRGNINVIIKRLKLDLNHHFGGGIIDEPRKVK